MKNLNQSNIRKKLVLTCCMAFLCCWAMPVFSQIQSVNTVQNLSFGAFTNGASGGSININNQGFRSATGSVILLNFGQTYFQALFDVTAPEGTIISILNGPDVSLTGNNGGTISLHIGTSEPASPFVANTGGTTQVSLGGRLTVGDAAATPPGNYIGTFNITFNNE